ncbi:hypothetical protein HU200_037467 [Digitaria exilis]|uniref:C2H2-type domain-containing protein n=1 Tax=Digitaria exilis TaxID=1010633 RepID=A0A835BBG0_9POAL|nr:hypothetical protein HU200_037467 [Digitaria exilis]CAB3453353.1 unnamed protein product [Digitaria exilis]CAB3504486.1 unnamed protein product [Digitaria exilis]
MERDGGHIKLQQLSRSDNFSLAASSWPPQQKRSSSSSSHTCGYCKREFRSAQGLGGHMNVHRMDRARLIHHQCSSHRLVPPPNPNPSPTVLDLLSSGCRCCRTHGAASDGGSLAMPTAKLGISRSSAMTITTKDFDVKNLELRMGACSHGDGAEERLDLELKLGYS